MQQEFKQGDSMTPELKQRIEQLRVGKVPIGYKLTRYGVYPNDWAIKNVGACINEYRELTNDIHSFPVYSSSRKGLIPQSEYYDQKDAKETNIGYKIVPANYVTYRHMSDDDVFHFNINHTGSSILVSSEYPVFATKKETDTIFLVSVLNSAARFRYFCRAQKLGGTRTRLYLQKLSQYQFGIPNLQEQEKISTILSAQNKVIELKEKRLAEKQRQKKYFMQQLLTGKKRLPKFRGNWSICRLQDITKRITKRNCTGNSNVLTISAQYGLINQSIFFDKTVASDDKSSYFFLTENDFAYNKSSSNGYPYGAIKRLTRYRAGIVSPLYICFRVKPACCSIDYLEQYFESGLINKEIQSFAQEGARNHGLLNIAVSDFFNSRLLLPPLDEQTAIAEILSTADREIDLLREDIEQEKQKKKALMQLLLTGIVRVTPCH